MGGPFIVAIVRPRASGYCRLRDEVVELAIESDRGGWYICDVSLAIICDVSLAPAAPVRQTTHKGGVSWLKL
jgi:hypothetical protein